MQGYLVAVLTQARETRIATGRVARLPQRHSDGGGAEAAALAIAGIWLRSWFRLDRLSVSAATVYPGASSLR